MEELIRSLSSLGLHPPTPAQLTDLLEPNQDSQKRLAQLLSLSTICLKDSDSDDGSESEDDLTTGLMSQDLIIEGIQSLLQNFNQSIEREKSLHQKELQALEKPVPLKMVPIKALLLRQESDIRRTRNDRLNCIKTGKGRVGYQPKLILDVGTPYCSTKSLFDLKQIGLEKGMKVPKRYEGDYLLVKVISELNHYVGVSFIVSDQNSNCIPVSLSHFLPQNHLDSMDDDTDLSKLLPVGTVVAIREPFISLNHYTRAGPSVSKQIIGVRVDSPDDLVILSGESFYDELGWKDIPFKGEATEIGKDMEARDGLDSIEGRWRQEGILTRLAMQENQSGRGIDPESSSKLELKEQNTPKVIFERIENFLKGKRIGAAHREFLSARSFGLLPDIKLDLADSSTDLDELLKRLELGSDSDSESKKIEDMLLLLRTLALESKILKVLELWNQLYKICQISLHLISSVEKELRSIKETVSTLNPDSTLHLLKTHFSQNLSKSQLLIQTCIKGPTSSQVQSFYTLSQTSLSPSMESPHYVNPKVAVVDLSHVGKGRGLVLLEDVEPGELLLCCKALGAAYPVEDEKLGIEIESEEVEIDLKSSDELQSNGALVNGDDHSQSNGTEQVNGNHSVTISSSKKPVRVLETILRLHFEKNSMSRTSQVKAATNVIHALMDQPALSLPFLGLTAGSIPNSTYVSEPYPLRWECSPSDLKPNLDLISNRLRGKGSFIDSAYVEGVLSFNAFGPSLGPGRSEGLNRKVPKEEGSQNPTTSHTDGTSSKTNGSIQQSSEISNKKSKVPPVELTGEFARSTMPHPLPAIMNHSCLPNVSSVFLGDIVTTRSLHYLPKGTEIVHQYVRGEEPYMARQSMTKKHGFDCGCPLCSLDNKDGDLNRKKREEILIRQLPTVVERSRIVLKPKAKFQEETYDKSISKTLDLDEKDVEAHQEIQERLIQLIEDLQETYHEGRPNLKPDLFEIWHRVALHSEAIGKVEEAIRYEINSLRSASAIPISDPLPPNMTQDLPSSSDEVVGGMKTSNMMLSRLPDLHFDNSIQSMLSISSLLLPTAPDLSSKWVSTAFWLHECVIAGGISVFLDRWADGVDLDLKKWSDLDSDGNGGLGGNRDGEGLLSGRWKDTLENWLKLKG